MIQKNVPSHLASNVDVIYVGDFEEFEKKRFNAAYQDGAIYVINVQDNAKDMADDIIHEMAHSLEEKYSDFIYGDGRLQNEFLGKEKDSIRYLKRTGRTLKSIRTYFMI